MDKTESLAAAVGSRSQFEREKERLIVEINQGMDAVNRNLTQLNQNLESAISLGNNFSRIASLWSEFGAIISPPVEDDGANNQNEEEHMDDEIADDNSDHNGDGSDIVHDSDSQMDTDL